MEAFLSKVFKKGGEHALKLLFPLLLLVFSISTIVVISMVSYLYIRYSIVPKAIIHEPIFFNFAYANPRAQINLFTTKQQWSSARENRFQQAWQSNGDSLKSDTPHSQIPLSRLASVPSAKQFKSDSTGETIANSSRPVSIPYQSPISLILENVYRSPFVFLGLFHRVETTEVKVPMINSFTEPTFTLPPTETLELSLSSGNVDLAAAHLTVMPVLNGVIYCMYYFPTVSFVVGVAFLCALIFGLVIGIGLIAWIYAYLSSNNSNNAQSQPSGLSGSRNTPRLEIEDANRRQRRIYNREFNLPTINESNRSERESPALYSESTSVSPSTGSSSSTAAAIVTSRNTVQLQSVRDRPMRTASESSSSGSLGMQTPSSNLVGTTRMLASNEISPNLLNEGWNIYSQEIETPNIDSVEVIGNNDDSNTSGDARYDSALQWWSSLGNPGTNDSSTLRNRRGR